MYPNYDVAAERRARDVTSDPAEAAQLDAIEKGINQLVMDAGAPQAAIFAAAFAIKKLTEVAGDVKRIAGALERIAAAAERAPLPAGTVPPLGNT